MLIHSKHLDNYILFIINLIILLQCCHKHCRSANIDVKSPYYQYLPDCQLKIANNKTVLHRGYSIINKITEAKGIICPMIKDEVGFLSEWTAYYEMHGFNHIIFYDNNSTTSFQELEPWIQTGFVSIRRNWWQHEKWLFSSPKNKFNDMMRVKMMAEVDCKRTAVLMGYEIFASVDMDEFLMPTRNDQIVIDELAEWFNTTTRGMSMLTKLQFPSVPHILEPINLLTIEAYQTRMRDADKMNYYTSVSKKAALRLLGGLDYTNDTVDFLIYCCDFHGCGNYKFDKRCPSLFKAGELWKLTGKHKKWREGPHIHHYARSLEKYIMKQSTWETAGSNRGYDIYNFLDRVLGYEYDNSGVYWGCQLRELLWNRTGELHYVRPGDMWYRNPEFGRVVSDPRKRGRHGSGLGKKLSPHEMNPYPPGDTYQLAHKSYEQPKE
eukprot:gene15398-20767_t